MLFLFFVSLYGTGTATTPSFCVAEVDLADQDGVEEEEVIVTQGEDGDPGHGGQQPGTEEM